MMERYLYFILRTCQTTTGILNAKVGDSDTATYYVRTILFGDGTKNEFTAQYKVRAEWHEMLFSP